MACALVFVVNLLALTACSGRCSRAPSASSGQTSEGTIELARRYELGDGVPRDYTRAIQIYEARCAGGDGDLVACRKLVAAQVAHRGELRDSQIDAWALLTRACQGGDWLACGPYSGFDKTAAQAACDADQGAACLAITWTHFMNQSGTVEAEDRERRRRACHLGVFEACLEIVEIANNAGDTPPTEAAAAVGRECDRGDADACELIGRPIDPAALCRANDFDACARIGANEPSVLERACDHDVVDACEQLALAARDADPPDPRVVERFARACALGSDTICRQNKPVDLAIGCAAYQPTRVPASKRKQLPRLSGTVAGAAWSAPAAQAFVVLRYDDRHGTPALYSEIAQRLGSEIDVYVLVGSDQDPAVFAPAIAVSLDPSIADAPLTAATNAGVGSPLNLRLRNGWPTIADTDGVPRAILSTEWGIQPVAGGWCWFWGLLEE
jgi:TPR repeat protein